MGEGEGRSLMVMRARTCTRERESARAAWSISIATFTSACLVSCTSHHGVILEELYCIFWVHLVPCCAAVASFDA